MKTRLILAVSLVGKTYVDKHYSNVYDFDKHTLDYKWERTGFEHLSNEEFKYLPNRVLKNNWFEKYMEDWCKLIDSNKYDVVVGWLTEEILTYLVNKNYTIEIVLIDPNSNVEEYVQRSANRGNNPLFWENLQEHILKMYNTYRNRKDVIVHTIKNEEYLSDLLERTGTTLIRKEQK